jgi:hypothetical protein
MPCLLQEGNGKDLRAAVCSERHLEDQGAHYSSSGTWNVIKKAMYMDHCPHTWDQRMKTAFNGKLFDKWLQEAKEVQHAVGRLTWTG